MIVSRFENGVPKELMLKSDDIEKAISEYLQKNLSQYGMLMPIEGMKAENVFGNPIYIITLEPEGGCQ